MARTATKNETGPEIQGQDASANDAPQEVETEVLEVEITDDQATISDPLEVKKTPKKARPKSSPTDGRDGDVSGKTSRATRTSTSARKAASVATKPGKSGKKTQTGGRGKKKSKKKAKNLSPAMTLGELSENYLAHLEEQGKGHGTLFSYGIELKMACRELGADTKISTLTEKKVKTYFMSDAVTKNRKGKPKARPTIDKTRRILRLTLVWLEETGVLAKAPIPTMKKPD